MIRERILLEIAFFHVILLGLAVLFATKAGWPGVDVVAGGAVMLLAYGLLWAAVHVLVHPGRRFVLWGVGILKIGLYLGLVLVAFRGGLAIDAGAFAAGVSCFPVAVLLTTAMSAIPRLRRAEALR